MRRYLLRRGIQKTFKVTTSSHATGTRRRIAETQKQILAGVVLVVRTPQSAPPYFEAEFIATPARWHCSLCPGLCGSRGEEQYNRKPPHFRLDHKYELEMLIKVCVQEITAND